MADIVDFQTEKIIREVVPELRSIDENGVMWFKFIIDYFDNNGSSFSFHIWAKNFDDADSRLRAIKTNAEIVGMLMDTVEGGM